MRATALAAVLLLSGWSAGCAATGDYTPQIHVVDGAAARVFLIPSHRPPPAAVAKASAAAHVHAMVAGEELGGPNATGQPGDLVLSNGEVVFVVAREAAGQAAGSLLDAADARDRKDELEQVVASVGTSAPAVVSLTTGETADGAAWVEAKGHDARRPDVEVTTRYTLRADERGLLLETVVANHGAEPTEALALGDEIRWGGATRFAPRAPAGSAGSSKGPFVGAVGGLASYGLMPTDGPVDASTGDVTRTEQKSKALAAGERESYARVLVVGQRPDTASVVSELAALAGEPLGGVEIALVDAGGKPVSVPLDAKARLGTPGGGGVSIRAWRGAFGGEVPPGDYAITFAGGGGRAPGAEPVAVSVVAGQVTKAALVVGDPAPSVDAASPPR